MSLNSKSFALLVALCLAVITIAVFSYLQELTLVEKVLAFVFLFTAFFCLLYGLLEFILFRQIQKLADKVLKARRGLEVHLY